MAPSGLFVKYVPVAFPNSAFPLSTKHCLLVWRMVVIHRHWIFSFRWVLRERHWTCIHLMNMRCCPMGVKHTGKWWSGSYSSMPNLTLGLPTYRAWMRLSDQFTTPLPQTLTVSGKVRKWKRKPLRCVTHRKCKPLVISVCFIVQSMLKQTHSSVSPTWCQKTETTSSRAWMTLSVASHTRWRVSTPCSKTKT